MARVGVYLMIFGFGSILLYLFNAHFFLLAWADDWQPFFGAAMGIVGGLLFLSQRTSGSTSSSTSAGAGTFPAAGTPQQYGQPQQFGQPQQYGQPQYGQPQYGQPQFGQPETNSFPPAGSPAPNYPLQQPNQQRLPDQPYQHPQFPNGQ